MVSGIMVALLVATYSVNPGIFLEWSLWWAIVVLMFLIAASRALVLREAITTRLRRSQALGIGLTAGGFALFSSSFILPVLPGTAPGSGPGSGTTGDLLFLFFFLLPWTVFFYWVDSSVLNAVRSDPLLRDILHWGASRKWVWTLLVLMVTVFVLWGIVLVGITGPRPNDVVDNSIGALTSFSIAGIPVVAGLVLLPLAVRRSRDPTIKRHLRWFAYFVGFLGLGVVVLILEIVSGIIPPLWQILWAVAGYCLYRSASSLVVFSQVPQGSDLSPEDNAVESNSESSVKSDG